MRINSKKLLTRKLDNICSQIIREQGYCSKCGKKENLQACHIFPRSLRSVRWDIELNIICLCGGCHRFWAHLNPIEFTEFVRNYLGKKEYEVLRRRARTIKKWTLDEMLELYEELKKMKTNLK